MTFSFTKAGVDHAGMVICSRGKVLAYENRCRHLPLSLDAGGGRFFTPDRRHLVCFTHGALYEPDTGLCVEGPCRGLKLKPLKVVLDGENGWIEYEDPVQDPQQSPL